MTNMVDGKCNAILGIHNVNAMHIINLGIPVKF